jgi:hypothetical protein
MAASVEETAAVKERVILMIYLKVVKQQRFFSEAQG